mmetsp:Transcript_104101/g.299619  ORF Transcript_104101/g.299619 Transcript_104101/m.299619 type:complete len:440 (+) Transcript_104101:281-1600(+)
MLARGWPVCLQDHRAMRSLDAGQVLGQLLLLLELHQALDQHPLRLRGARAMQALREVAYRVPAHGHVLDEAEDAPAMLYRDALLAFEVLVEQGPRDLVAEVLVGGQGHEDTAREVLCEAPDLVGVLRDVVLADVRHEHVRQEVPRRHCLPTVGGREGRARDVLVQVRDLDDLVLDVRGLGHAVVVRHRRRGAEHHVAEARLADVGAAVVGREALDEGLRELGLAVHEDVLRRHNNVMEGDDGLLATVLCVSLLDVAALEGTGVATLAPIDVRQPGSVHGHGASDSEVLFVVLQALARHNDHPVRVQHAGLVGLDAAQDHCAIRLPRVDAHEDVRVLLLARAEVPVALGVRHRAAEHEVLALAHGHEGAEALVVLRAVLLVDVVGRAPHRVGRVLPHAALEAGAGAAAELALHERLLHEVFRGFADVEEAAHAVAREADR